MTRLAFNFGLLWLTLDVSSLHLSSETKHEVSSMSLEFVLRWANLDRDSDGELRGGQEHQ